MGNIKISFLPDVELAGVSQTGTSYLWGKERGYPKDKDAMLSKPFPPQFSH